MKKSNLPLTKKKSEWVKNRDVTLRGTDLAYNASQQAKYQSALQALVRQMSKETKRELTKLFESEIADKFIAQQKKAASMAMDAPSITTKAKKLTNKLLDKFNLLFAFKAPILATKMVTGAKKVSESSLKTSLRKLSGGLSLNTGVVPHGMEDVAKAIIDENVSLITSIPQQYFTQVSGAVMRSITTGQGMKDLLPQIQKHSAVSYRRAKNIALDQTRKAYNFINKQRMQAIGVKEFTWQHSGGGQHPRESHIALSGHIFSFDDLPVINQEQVNAGYEAPVRGIPGQAINCRCTMNPVIDFSS